MQIYTFYPTRADGVATTFASEDCKNDTQALLEAVLLLEEHESAASVVIWQGARRVLTCVRTEEPAPRLV